MEIKSTKATTLLQTKFGVVKKMAAEGRSARREQTDKEWFKLTVCVVNFRLFMWGFFKLNMKKLGFWWPETDGSLAELSKAKYYITYYI